jgi:Protein of unknown function (DUF3300)
MMSLSKLLRRSCAIATSGALGLSSLPAMAQDQPLSGAQLPPPSAVQQTQPAQQLGQAELEKLLAPIALYPDDLVAQILTASTYPLEVIEAARWVNAHQDLRGNALQDAMQQQSWDASVKGLTAVPQVLAMMNDKLDWTQQLGEAFLAQPNDVSNAIQQLRLKAQATGNLKSSKEIRVSTVAAQGPPPGPPPVGVDPALLPPPPPPEYIVIEPADPDVYYVPIYDPTLVYGPWPWPAYAPFYWYPPGYVLGATAIGFGVGFFVGSSLWCHYNWGGGWSGGPVTINVARYNQFNHTNFAAQRNGFSSWQFNAAHRGAVGFQNATLRQQYGHPNNLQGTRGTFQGTLQGTQGQFHGNQSLTHGRTGPQTGPLNANVNTNAKFNRNLSHNPNVQNLKNNPNVQNLNVNRNNMNSKVNRNLNVNRNASFNRNTGGPNRGANFTRNARPTPHGGQGNKGHH